MKKTYYEVLGLPYFSTKEEIKERYQKLSRFSILKRDEVALWNAFSLLSSDLSRPFYDASLTNLEKKRILQYSKWFCKNLTMFDILEKKVGHEVEIAFHESGTVTKQKGTINFLEPFWYVLLDNQVFPFFGDDCGVVCIKEGKQLCYGNRNALQRNLFHQKDQKVRKITSF